MDSKRGGRGDHARRRPAGLGLCPPRPASPPRAAARRCCTTRSSSTRPSPSLGGWGRCTTRARSLRPPLPTQSRVRACSAAQPRVPRPGAESPSSGCTGPPADAGWLRSVPCLHAQDSHRRLCITPACRRAEPGAAGGAGHERGVAAALAHQHAGAPLAPTPASGSPAAMPCCLSSQCLAGLRGAPTTLEQPALDILDGVPLASLPCPHPAHGRPGPPPCCSGMVLPPATRP